MDFVYFISFVVNTATGPQFSNHVMTSNTVVDDEVDIRDVEECLAEILEIDDPATIKVMHFHLLTTSKGTFEQVICPFCESVVLSHVCPPKE